jgi:hypothetical protein
MSIHNITEYKKAQVVVKDLEKVLKVINAAEASLMNYDRYRPVSYILTTLGNEKMLLQIYLEQYKIILETKGAKGI